MLKFPTKYEVGQIRDNQAIAHEYFLTTLRAENQSAPTEIQPGLSMGFDSREDLIDGCPQPIEDLLDVLLRKKKLSRMVKIGSRLYKVTKYWLINLLQENTDLFVWSTADISDIDSYVISHHLNVDPTCWSVKQKKQWFAPERQEAIAEKVDKLL